MKSFYHLFLTGSCLLLAVAMVGANAPEVKQLRPPILITIGMLKEGQSVDALPLPEFGAYFKGTGDKINGIRHSIMRGEARFPFQPRISTRDATKL
jgi:hypothetical protein